MVLGNEVGVEHVAQQRLGRVRPLVALVAQVDRVVLVAVDDRLPGVEQIDDPLLDARGPLPALFLVHRLLQQAAVEQLAQLLLEADADRGELLGAERGL